MANARESPLLYISPTLRALAGRKAVRVVGAQGWGVPRTSRISARLSSDLVGSRRYWAYLNSASDEKFAK